MTNSPASKQEDMEIQGRFQVGDVRLHKLFWRSVRANETTGCWEWQRTIDRDGYAMYGSSLQPTRMAHRLAYLSLVGPIPEGLHLDHLCRVRNCVNPAHLEPVTTYENSRRGNSWLWLRARTHCPKGHPYDQENTSINSYGWRRCRACTKAKAEARLPYTREYMRKKRTVKREQGAHHEG